MFRALAEAMTRFRSARRSQTGQWFDALDSRLRTQIFIIGWKIALPVFVATFLMEITVGFIARMQPQINTMVVTAPLEAAGGSGCSGRFAGLLAQGAWAP